MRYLLGALTELFLSTQITFEISRLKPIWNELISEKQDLFNFQESKLRVFLHIAKFTTQEDIPIWKEGEEIK